MKTQLKLVNCLVLFKNARGQWMQRLFELGISDEISMNNVPTCQLSSTASLGGDWLSFQALLHVATTGTHVNCVTVFEHQMNFHELYQMNIELQCVNFQQTCLIVPFKYASIGNALGRPCTCIFVLFRIVCQLFFFNLRTVQFWTLTQWVTLQLEIILHHSSGEQIVYNN